MKKIYLPAFLACVLLFCTVQVFGYPETYRGAVVEYYPINSGDEKSSVAKNVDNYKTFIKLAESKKADIIVFPEMGLSTLTISSPIPDPIDRIVPCDNNSFETTEIVKNLSCASKGSKIYSVVNLLEKRKCDEDDINCPSQKYYLFNTNVAFDRSGAVIARFYSRNEIPRISPPSPFQEFAFLFHMYAKYNLFDETRRDQPKDPEIVFFDTDFGVRFGTFICFDILFQVPTLKLVQQYGITDFVFTSFWFSEIPFLTALQVQRGWAESNNVNLLASGLNKPSKGSGGSGIYNGKYGHLVEIFPENTTSKLLVADILKIESRPVADFKKDAKEISETFMSVFNTVIQEEATEDLVLLKDQIQLFNSKVIKTDKPFEQTICSARNFCCDFYVDVDEVNVKAKDYTYRAVVFNGRRRFGHQFKGGVQACGIILCYGSDILNCTNRVKNIPGLFNFKEIKIRGDFKLRNSFQMPSTLTDGDRLEPLTSNKYEFRKTEKKNSVEVSLELLWPVSNLHTFAIWGRDFTRDNEPEFPVANGPLIASAPYLILTFVGFILFAR